MSLKNAFYGLLVVLAVPISAQSAHTWYKRYVEIRYAGQVVARITDISTVDEGYPFWNRRLYGDSLGNRFVIRDWLVGDDGSGTTTIQYLGTGETLTFDNLNDDMTVTLGDQTLVVPAATVLKALPPAIQAAADALIASSSQVFRDALERFCFIGCNQSQDLILDGYVPKLLFYRSMNCPGHRDYMDPATEVNVGNFDPTVTPPNAFEQQFGQAYYE